MEQRTETWHQLRKTKIGSSDAAAILNVSPFKSSYDVWIEKISNEMQSTPQNRYMARGIELEPEALRAFEIETGCLMSPTVLLSQKYEFMMASLDGMDIDGNVAVEIKCPGRKDHECALKGKIPDKYMPQLQHQLVVSGLNSIFYFSYSPESFKLIEVHRDNEYIKNLIDEESKFYYNHMLTKIPPNHKDNFLDMVSEEWIVLSNEYKKIERQEKEATRRKEEIKDLLVQLSSSKNARGNGIALQKIERRGIIDYQNIPEIKKINLEEYRKPSTSYWGIKEINNGISST